MSRGRAVASEQGVEDLEMGSAVAWGRAALMFQQGTTAVQDWCFNSRARSDAGPNKPFVRASVPPPFEQLAHASTSVAVWDGSVIALSAAESLENNESGIEESVSIDPWLGGRSMVNRMSTANGGLVRELEG